MNPNKLFPLIVTDDLDQSRTYYAEVLGFEVSMEMPGYVQFRVGADPAGPELAIMTPNPDAGHTAFGGHGLIVSIPTPNADETHTRYQAAGAHMLSQPSDKPWGWRSFALRDPNGVVLDFFHVQRDGVADAPG